jgi:hypothetical protein
VPYYVIGGEYADTSFRTLVKPAPTDGPFERYEDAYTAWRGRAIATIDLAYVRFRIVRSDSPPTPDAVEGGRA